MPKLEGPQFGLPTKTDAVKYTLVKKGQQHPMGEKGQYKLFHTHQWPRGYSPARLSEIKAVMPLVVDSGDNEEHPYFSELIAQSLARSTIPVSHLRTAATQVRGKKNVAEPLEIHVNVDMPHSSGMFSDTSNEILIGENPATSHLGHVAIHELGHARNYYEDPKGTNFKDHKEDRILFKLPGGEMTHIHPRMEGLAEGYRLAHQRETRASLRTIRKNDPTIYRLEGFQDKLSKDQFVQARQESYDRETKDIF